MIKLTGLSEANLVGYLAGLGVQRLVNLVHPSATLRWEGCAVLETVLDEDQLVSLLDTRRSYGFDGRFMTFERPIYEEGNELTLKNSLCDIQAGVKLNPEGKPVMKKGRACQFPPGQWARLQQEACTNNQHGVLELMCALRTSLENNREGKDKEAFPDASFLNRLRDKSGKTMLKAVRGLLLVGKDKLRRDLFNPWKYQDHILHHQDLKLSGLALGLDDQEGNDKGSNPKEEGHTNHGAGMLALHGLTNFPCFDCRGRVRTTCARGYESEFIYPVWGVPLVYDAIQYLIRSDFQELDVRSYRVKSVQRGKVSYLDLPVLV